MFDVVPAPQITRAAVSGIYAPSWEALFYKYIYIH